MGSWLTQLLAPSGIGSNSPKLWIPEHTSANSLWQSPGLPHPLLKQTRYWYCTLAKKAIPKKNFFFWGIISTQWNTQTLSVGSGFTDKLLPHTLIKTQNISITPEISLMSLASTHPSIYTNRRQPLIWFPPLQVPVAVEWYRNGNIPHVLFCVWLPSLSKCLKSMHAVACITRSLFCFLSE